MASMSRTIFALVAAGLAAGCASSAAAPELHPTVRVEPVATSGAAMSGAAASTGSGSGSGSGSGADAQRAQRVPQAAASAPISTPADTLPALPDALPTSTPLSAAPQRRISVDVPAGTTIATALGEVAESVGLAANVDPNVQGTIDTPVHLRNVTVDEALRQLATSRGYQYQLQSGVLRVVPVQLATKTFSLDYVSISRVGTMSTVVQRRLSTSSSPAVGTATGLSPFSGGGGSVAASGGDVLSAQSVADVWNEIRVALVGILQAGQTGPPAESTENARTQTSATQTAAGGFGSGAVSIPFSDGSSLIITPMAGLITVTAKPEKLAAVERFIDAFQASVLREVRIEAQIVEVRLTNNYQYGIDWSVINKAGNAGFTLRSDPSVTTTGNTGNVNFTLNGGSTSINAVISALSSFGTVSVLSTPNTTALNNQRAIFDVTSDEVFFSVTRTPLLGANGGVVSFQESIIPQSVSVGVTLDVLPQISASNVLTMDIRPQVTSISRVDSITTSDGTHASAPVIDRREGDTIARMRAGETMVIGGLIEKSIDHEVSGIPVLKDLPLVGKAFSHVSNQETRSELVIFLTPTIIAAQPAAGPAR